MRPRAVSGAMMKGDGSLNVEEDSSNKMGLGKRNKIVHALDPDERPSTCGLSFDIANDDMDPVLTIAWDMVVNDKGFRRLHASTLEPWFEGSIRVIQWNQVEGKITKNTKQKYNWVINQSGKTIEYEGHSLKAGAFDLFVDGKKIISGSSSKGVGKMTDTDSIQTFGIGSWAFKNEVTDVLMDNIQVFNKAKIVL